MSDRKFLWTGRSFFGLMVILMVMGCNENGKVPAQRNASPDALYFDYKLWGDEESNNITLNLQYRLGGSEGEPVKLTEPGHVTLDGQLIEPDSSRMNGVYYEINIPVPDFAGPHSIIYTDANGRKYKEEFEFPIISLKTELPKVLTRSGLQFQLAGLDTLDAVRIIVTDTSFYGRGIDRFDTIRNGLITINETDLSSLRKGPVYMEFYKEEEWPLKETLPQGGRFSLSYAVKRVFELRDSTNSRVK